MAAAASLPPRRPLPRDVDIPALPGVGVTWYDRGGAFPGGLLRIGYLLAVLAIAVVLLFCPAVFLAMFLASLPPEPLTERQARLWMAERLRQPGHGTAAG